MSTKRISYTDSKGKVHLITEMGTIHISNAIKKLRLNNSEDIQLITALQNELDKRIAMKTKLPVQVADDPLRAVVRGTGIALKNRDRFTFLMS